MKIIYFCFKQFLGELEKKKILRPHEIYEIFSNIKEILDINETMISQFVMAKTLELPAILKILALNVRKNFYFYISFSFYFIFIFIQRNNRLRDTILYYSGNEIL